MWSTRSCPSCEATDLRWEVRRAQTLTEVTLCAACDEVIARWEGAAPRAWSEPNLCRQCGEPFGANDCSTCREGQAAEHSALQALAEQLAPGAGVLAAIQRTMTEGRYLTGLRLCDLQVPPPHEAHRRALQLWLLGAIGERHTAKSHAEAWVHSVTSGREARLARVVLAQLCGDIGELAEARRALVPLETAGDTAATAYAVHLCIVDDELDEALELATGMLAHRIDRTMLYAALSSTEELLSALERAGRGQDADTLVSTCDDITLRSFPLLVRRARAAASEGRTSDAQRDLTWARRLNPQHDMFRSLKSP